MTLSILYPLAGKRVYVSGHRGLVGRAITRRIADQSVEILTVDRAQLDLRDQSAVTAWMQSVRPDCVFLAAATVGGILANSTRPAEFLYDNLMIEANIIHASYLSGVQKLLFLGSSCIYPKYAPQPLSEDSLLTGPLEATNEWYAIAKIAGIKLTQAYRRQYGCDFISAMPTSLYGIGDLFHLQSSHVIPALMRKMHEAKIAASATVSVWGTGAPLREFLYVDDLADALVFLMERYSEEKHINIGVGTDLSIRDLAELIAKVVGYDGALEFDTTKPDGTPRKLMDVSRLHALGWTAATPLEVGLQETYEWYLEHQDTIRTGPAI